MKRIPFVFLALTFVVSVISSCSSSTPQNNSITSAPPTEQPQEESFKETFPNAQHFTLDALKDQVIEGKDGTVIVVPKGAFIDQSGNTVTGPVTLHLTEALDMNQMIHSNLSTTSDGMLLETGGMLHIDAENNGKKVNINPKSPLHIEIPTNNLQPEMMVYKGVRDINGNINWVNPKPITNYLQTIPLADLDFLPPGFFQEVAKNLPYKGHTTATKDLADSLYYSLNTYTFTIEPKEVKVDKIIDLQEPHSNPNKEIKDGKYTKDSYWNNAADTVQLNNSGSSYQLKGIKPASIKTIKSSEYQNSLIATREFEKRIQLIFESCSNEVLQLYINNLEKNLYEIDQIAAKKCYEIDKKECGDQFEKFASLRQTKVKDTEAYALLLRDFYSKKLKEVEKELEQLEAEHRKKLHQIAKEEKKVIDAYTKVLWKREKYRMERYGFQWSNTGWVNVDKPVVNGRVIYRDTLRNENINVKVKEGAAFDRVNSYIIFEDIRSIYRLTGNNKTDFYPGFENNKTLVCPKNAVFNVVTIGYKGEVPYFACKELQKMSNKATIEMTLIETTEDGLKELLNKYEKYKNENNITVDQQYMKAFFEANKRRAQLIKESKFLGKLRQIAFPCDFLETSELR